MQRLCVNIHPSGLRFYELSDRRLYFDPVQKTNPGRDMENSQLKVKLFSAFQPFPDLIDASIILLISTSINIFIFWLASQSMDDTVFAQLPDFITGTFSSIWASIAAGTAGVGLVVVKALVRKGQPRPHYLLYILVSSLSICLIVVLLGSALFKNKPHMDPPVDVEVVDLKQNDVRKFDLETPQMAGMASTYAMTGSYSIKAGHIVGHVDPIEFRTNDQFKPQYPLSISRAALSLCYIHILKDIPGLPQLNGTLGVESSPRNPKSSNATPVFNIVLNADQTNTLPGFDFDIPVPSDYRSRRGWLCGQVYNGSGFFPAQ